MIRSFSLVFFIMLVLCALVSASAGIKLPSIIGDHMVLQQNQENSVWGWDIPESVVSVEFGGRKINAIADTDGKWQVRFNPGTGSYEPRTIIIRGTNTVTITDVLVGEVWICAGQSNMAFKLSEETNGDVEAYASRKTHLRLISVPQVGSQELKIDFDGKWKTSAPDIASQFSAIGFLYGRYLQEILDVPVGMIDITWGGSIIEAWLPRSSLDADLHFAGTIERLKEAERKALLPQDEKALAAHMAEWERQAELAQKQGRSPPIHPIRNIDWLQGRERAGNIFGGMVNPVIGYGIKGFIWYQGESNAPWANEYGNLFPRLISEYRNRWGLGDFSFYWVQITAFGASEMDAFTGKRAELREAQTNAMYLKNTGQVVSIDLGEAKDVHPRKKHEIAMRLLRWSLANDYGFKIQYRSPEFESVEIVDGKAIVTFNCYGSKLRPFGVSDVVGFSVCDEKGECYKVNGRKISDNQVEIRPVPRTKPILIRYAWADNPECNLFNENGLPATPFQTEVAE
jgi:sialate O-acetylesterase